MKLLHCATKQFKTNQKPKNNLGKTKTTNLRVCGVLVAAWLDLFNQKVKVWRLGAIAAMAPNASNARNASVVLDQHRPADATSYQLRQ